MFENLFERLNINDYVTYGTFAKISEKLINKSCDIRKKTIDLFNGNLNNNSSNQNHNLRPKLLLIDEVDVFFSENFYG